MTVTPSVDTHSDGRSADALTPDPYGWDWSATTHDARGSGSSVRDVSAELIESLGGEFYVPGKGLQGWSESVQVFDGDGFKVGTVYFCASADSEFRSASDRPDVHVVSTSSEADASRWAVAGKFNAKTSRVDTRVDSRVPYDELVQLIEEVAGPRTQLVRYEGYTMGDGSTGRTLYVGAPTSMVRVRLYEKWLESPGQYEDGTNRVEVQLRPPSRGKEKVSGWSPAETFCASKLTRRLAHALGSDLAAPGSLQKAKGTPDLERSLEAMGTQYGKAVGRWLDLSGGDLGKVLDYLAPLGSLTMGRNVEA